VGQDVLTSSQIPGILQRSDDRWFAIQVRPRHELKVAVVLEFKGYVTYVPLYCCRRKWSDRWKVLSVPLFAGYVFCQINPDVLLPIISTPGVIRIVRTGGRPAPVDSKDIQAVQIIVKSRQLIAPCPYLTVGSRVRIIDGPLTGLQGILGEQKNKQLIVSVHLLQSSIAVVIDNLSVISIEDARRSA
jgi:transcription antitermination factor NusG